MENVEVFEGLTFDDILLIPQYSEVLPHEVDVSTQLTKRIKLNIPIVSAAMDTVTDHRMAIAIAREGGIGIIHRNMRIEDQAKEVERVKKSESGMIVNPVTVRPDTSVKSALEIMERYKISGVPVVSDGNKLVGILTNRDLRFIKPTDYNKPVSMFMTKENLIVAKERITLEEAKEILHRHKIEKLPIVDKEGNLVGLITIKDIVKRQKYPNACKDEMGRLRVGAAVGTGPDTKERVSDACFRRCGCDRGGYSSRPFKKSFGYSPRDKVFIPKRRCYSWKRGNCRGNKGPDRGWGRCG